MKKYIVYFVCATMLFVSCLGAGSYESLSVEDFEKVISESNVQLVDVRTPDEYSSGHIKGSINIDAMDSSFETSVDELLCVERPVAIYCRSGRRSKSAAEVLSGKGYDVVELNLGYNAWVEYKGDDR